MFVENAGYLTTNYLRIIALINAFENAVYRKKPAYFPTHQPPKGCTVHFDFFQPHITAAPLFSRPIEKNHAIVGGFELKKDRIINLKGGQSPIEELPSHFRLALYAAGIAQKDLGRRRLGTTILGR